MHNRVIPECYIDTCLVNVVLGLGKQSANHGKGNTTVAQKMISKFKDQFSVAIIDKDKRKIDYLKEFEIVNEQIADYTLLFRHKNEGTHHYIIQLCPESETWICNVAREIGINLVEEYSLPDDPKKLAGITKNITSKDDERFVKLFKHIIRQSEAINFEPVIKLKGWLNKLVNDNYKVDVNELRK